MNNKYDAQYKKMQGSVTKAEILRFWNTIGAYMEFYEDWVKECCRITPTKKNPNRRLLKRWNK